MRTSCWPYDFRTSVPGAGGVLALLAATPDRGAAAERPARFPSAMISVNGGQLVEATVDAGSTTLVVTQGNFPIATNAVKLRPGWIEYSSSHITESGTYYLTDVVIGGVGTTATSHVPVLRADKITSCDSMGEHCRTNRSIPLGRSEHGGMSA